ncbi:MAG: acyltransferase family protein [Candidatus Saccharibacteria bacterium]
MTDAKNPDPKRKGRLVSLDALRGFDMFWIIGAGVIASGLVDLHLPLSTGIAHQLSHSKWNGFTFYDLIFPLFVFITGVSTVLSLSKRMDREYNRREIIKHIVKRTVILFLVGIVYYDQITFPPHLSRIRIMGVLQRIAICYFFASMLILYTKPKTQAIITGMILLGYWAIMRFVPVPGYGPGVWTEQHNLAKYIDNLLLPGRLFYDTWDPEGLLTTIPAIATCILGVLSGYWLKATDWMTGQTLDEKQRAAYLFLAGLVLVVLSLVVNPIFPINKNLWTSSFVLLTGGLSAILLAGSYWVIDIEGFRLQAFPFMIIGLNSIFIYFAVRFIPFEQATAWLLARYAHLGRAQTLVAGFIALCIECLILYVLYRRKIFVRI